MFKAKFLIFITFLSVTPGALDWVVSLSKPKEEDMFYNAATKLIRKYDNSFFQELDEIKHTNRYGYLARAKKMNKDLKLAAKTLKDVPNSSLYQKHKKHFDRRVKNELYYEVGDLSEEAIIVAKVLAAESSNSRVPECLEADMKTVPRNLDRSLSRLKEVLKSFK